MKNKKNTKRNILLTAAIVLTSIGVIGLFESFDKGYELTETGWMDFVSTTGLSMIVIGLCCFGLFHDSQEDEL